MELELPLHEETSIHRSPRAQAIDQRRRHPRRTQATRRCSFDLFVHAFDRDFFPSDVDVEVLEPEIVDGLKLH